MEIQYKKALERLKKCIGHVYMYRGRNVKVLGYNRDEPDCIEIVTETAPIHTTIGNLMALLDEFLEVEDPEEATATLTVYSNQTTGLDSLEQTLLDNIERLKKDPNFLQQAKEINSTAKSLIQITKTKVDLFREVRKANQ